MKVCIKYIIVVLVLLTTACSEKILQTCMEDPDIEFSLEALKKEISGDSTLLNGAENASFTLLHKNYQTGVYSELAMLPSNINGEALFQVPNSGCGISGVKVKANVDLFYIEKIYDFLCCDTTFTFVFESDSLRENEVVLDSVNIVIIDSGDEVVLDSTSVDIQNNIPINVNLTNEFGGCIVESSSEASFGNDRFLYIDSKESVRVNVSNVFTLDAPFYANISEAADNNGWITIGSEGINEFYIGFLADTDIEGIYTTSVTLPMEYLNGSGKTVSIKVNLATEICSDDACNCPFAAENSIFTIDHTSEDILPGETISYEDNILFTVDDNMVSDNCFLEVAGIQRYPSGKSADEIDEADEAKYNWKLTTEFLVGDQFALGDEFEVDLVFSPTSQGILKDTFEVFLNVVDNDGNILDEECSFLIEASGKTCFAPIPEIVLNNFYDARVVNSGVVTDTLQFGATLAFSQSDYIYQELDSKLESLCPAVEYNQEAISYQLQFPEAEEDYCSNLILVFKENMIGANDDVDFFEPNFDLNTEIAFAQGSGLEFSVTFNAPDIVSHLRSGHSDEYRIEYEIIALTVTMDTIAVQKVELKSSVFNTIAEVSEPQLMRSFRQISDLQSNPSYQAFKIDELNPYYNYYGKVDNLSPQQGNVDFTSDPVLPSTNHSFIFEVDEPTNKTKLQTPKLYLVQNSLNKFTKVTSLPVAQYTSSDAFTNDLDNLITKIYSNSTFTSDATPSATFQFISNQTSFNWFPSLAADQMTLGNGVELVLGGVYIIWNPLADKSENLDINGENYDNFCDVALLYIDGVSDGSGTTTHTGYVGFYVAYPLGLVKN